MCGFEIAAAKPQKGCPRCGSGQKEFLPAAERGRLEYDGKPFDLLLINGSSHRAGNTGYMLEIAEGVLRDEGVSCRRYNLSEYRIDHCWCCYSVKASYCTYPCRNQDDDMPAFHRMLSAARGVIVASPINWNGMPARLKDFLDRTTCMENLYHLKKGGLTEGKVAGILVNGHEDGGIKTAMDIFLYFEQMGFILAPFGIAYRTHGATFDTASDAEFFRKDGLLAHSVRGVASNVVELLRLDTERRLKGKLVPVAE